jgi:hypothetical protein
MKLYKNLSGKAGIQSYETAKDHLILDFGDPYLYLYDWKKPGQLHVEKMKRLAISGKGLTLYVNQYVRRNYAKKFLKTKQK